MQDSERLPGAVKALRQAITPLIHETPAWDGHRASWCDSLYRRMMAAKTAAGSKSGAPMQASKTPARMDVLAWFVNIDSVVAQWPGPAMVTELKLGHYHDRTWNPTELRFIKAVTKRCEQWGETAKHLLGDNPPQVPLRRPCPACEQLWDHTTEDRQWALKVTATVDNWHAQCTACKTVWYTDAEQALFRRMLGE